MSPTSLTSFELPATVALAAIAAIGYVVSHARHGRSQFGILDALLVLVLMGIVGAAVTPCLRTLRAQAQQSAVLENLYAIRSQIELYKVQHGGKAPILYKGTFPQLTEATDASGIPGPPGSRHRFGPYFPAGLPKNPLSGHNRVAACETFPPPTATGSGGWVYHQPSGRIAIDQPGYLAR